jgi:hypothetical protein
MMVSSGRPLELEHRVLQAHKALAELKEPLVLELKELWVLTEHKAQLEQAHKVQLEQMAHKEL